MAMRTTTMTTTIAADRGTVAETTASTGNAGIMVSAASIAAVASTTTGDVGRGTRRTVNGETIPFTVHYFQRGRARSQASWFCSFALNRFDSEYAATPM